MLERESIETKKKYGDDVLARVKRYQKEAAEKKLTKEETTAGSHKKVAELREERMEEKKKLLAERARKIER